MKKITFISSAIIASSLGVAIGMLFAPHKGSVTRRKITRKNDIYADYISDKFDDFIDSVTHPLESLEAQTARLSSKAKSKANKVQDKVSAATK